MDIIVFNDLFRVSLNEFPQTFKRFNAVPPVPFVCATRTIVARVQIGRLSSGKRERVFFPNRNRFNVYRFVVDCRLLPAIANGPFRNWFVRVYAVVFATTAGIAVTRKTRVTGIKKSCLKK